MLEEEWRLVAVEGRQEFRGWHRKKGAGLGQGVRGCGGLETLVESQAGEQGQGGGRCYESNSHREGSRVSLGAPGQYGSWVSELRHVPATRCLHNWLIPGVRGSEHTAGCC